MIWVSNHVRHKPAVQSQKQARSLKFQIEEEGLHYLCSKNKGADQLCSYCTADCAVTAQLICAFVFGFLPMHTAGFLMRQLVNNLYSY